MATYKEIKGVTVQTRDEDPSLFVGSWSSGDNLNTARNFLSGSGAGTLTSSIAFGGDTGSVSALTENYNGTSWTEVNDLNTARNGLAGFGTATAAIAADSRSPLAGTAVESWDGSSWTEIAENNTGHSLARGFGVQTAGNIVGGADNSPGSEVLNLNEYWNGSSWTELNDLNTARHSLGASGVYTAGLVAGGYNGTANVAVHEQWNGSTWTESTDLNTARRGVGSSGPSSTAALISAGYTTTYSSVTEDWNGSAWTEVADLSTGREQHHGSGSSTSGLAFGGSISPGVTAATEEWTFSGVQPGDEASYSDAIVGDFYYNSTTGQFKNVVLGTKGWSSGGDLPTGRYRTKAMGTQTATLAALGSDPSAYNNTSLHYDGSSWTESQALNRAPGVAGGAAGTQTAAIIGGGYNSGGPSPNSKTTETEIYNGTSWTEVNNTNTGRSGNPGTGTTTAAIIFGGTTTVVSPSHPSKAVTGATETWDGTNWTEVGDLNTARESLAGSGTTNPYTTALAFGGTKAPYPPGTRTGETELWNGSAWTEVADLNTSREIESGGAGDSGTSALAFGGYTSTAVANTEEWDGTSWTEVADLATARYGIGGTGTGTTAICVSGGPGNITATEEFSQPAFDIKTVTTS